MIPGELFIKDGDIELNAGRKTVTLTVAGTGDRPIQVGSHYHFFETNPALKFDRRKRAACASTLLRDGSAFRAGANARSPSRCTGRQADDLRFSRRRDGQAVSIFRRTCRRHPEVRALSCAPRRMSRVHEFSHPSRLAARAASHLRMTHLARGAV